MGIRFEAISSQFLENLAPPITAFPFTVGYWIYWTVSPPSGGTIPWSLAASANNTHYFNTYVDNTAFFFAADQGGAQSFVTVPTIVPTNGIWYYLLHRSVTATNRRMSVLTQDGVVAHGGDTTSQVPVVNRAAIGCRDVLTRGGFINAVVGEYFMTNTDIQSDGLALLDATLRQLAYLGPFSMSHVATNIIEYRSFRKGVGSTSDDGNEVYGKDRQVWTPSGGPITGIHPPLPGAYVRPNQTKRLFMV